MDRASLLLLVGSAGFNALGSTLMKYAYGGDEGLIASGWLSAILRILLDPWTMAGLASFGISFFFMAAVLSRTDLTLAYPFMSALVYLMLLIIGAFFFHERVTTLRLTGMILILIGIALLSVKN